MLGDLHTDGTVLSFLSPQRQLHCKCIPSCNSRMWNSIVSVPDHCLFICFVLGKKEIFSPSVYAATLFSLGAKVKFRRGKPNVLVALLVTLLMC